jgi:hypothetical protein
MLLPIVCSAQTKCPWLNEATARGILGGEVIMTVDITPRGDGVCKFSRQQGDDVFQLRISVEKMTDVVKQFATYLAQCPPKSPALHAVGNDAVTCSTEGSGGQFGESVISRVRGAAFMVSVSSTKSGNPQMTKQMRRDKANVVAEQVAGILF